MEKKIRLTLEELAMAHDGLCGISIKDGPCSCLVQWFQSLQEENDKLKIECRGFQSSTREIVLGIGFDSKKESCSLTIRLMKLNKNIPNQYQFTMQVCAHNDEWRAFEICDDILKMLSKNGIPSGEMVSDGPFYNLRKEVEKLG